MRGVVATLSSCSPEVLGGAALRLVLETLQRNDLLAVTRDDYFVFLTPPGLLYDKSVVPGYATDFSVMSLRCTWTEL